MFDSDDDTTLAHQIIAGGHPTSPPESPAWHTVRILQLRQHAEALSRAGCGPDDPAAQFIQQRIASAFDFMRLSLKLAAIARAAPGTTM